MFFGGKKAEISFTLLLFINSILVFREAGTRCVSMCKKLLARTIKYFVFAVLVLSACDRYEDDFTEIRAEIAQIKEAISALQQAYDNAKTISSVTALSDETPGGWLITFSDNTTIKVVNGKDGENGANGKDGITPYFKINEDNHWCVSYDGGVTYDIILDSEGKPVSATGADGENGKNGNSVRVVINAEGYYVIEIYETATNTVIDSITTPYSSNPQNTIQSIVENTSSNTITITMESGEVFTFDKMVIYPSSIVLLDDEISLAHCEEATIEFIVNPSNAAVLAKDFQLNLVKEITKAEVSYITTPDAYSIKSVANATDKEGNTIRGKYIMTIKDNGTKLDYNERFTIVIAIKDSKGNPMEITSEIISVSYTRPSSLARVFITTPDGVGITSKTDWLKNSNIRIVDEDGNEDLNVTTSVRGRGNTTWTYPKKPYAIKLDSKAEVLGMPKHKRWVLLANWMDRTLLRNDVAFEMARRVMAWAPRGQFVELYLNGVHQGNYYLCEQIKVDKNRVNIDELDEDTDFSDPSQVSGGYILEFDEYGQFDEPNFFWSKIIDIDDGTPVTIKEPDEEVITSHTHPGFLYIQNYVYNIEDILEADKEAHARWSEIEQLIDVTSYIDWWLVHELSGNLEPNQPRSCYMYKKRDGKLYAGPVWDFDWGTFKPTYNHFGIKSTLWYIYLFKYPEFKSAVKARWAEVEDTFRGIDQYIVDIADKTRESNELNLSKWPISSTVNGDESMPYDEAIARMREAYQHRLDRIDGNVSAM